MPLRLSPADITYEDLERADAETNPGLLPEIARVARGFACGLYRDYPGALGIGQQVSPSVIDVREVLLKRMCSAPEYNPPELTKQFSGGQCDILYQVRVMNSQSAAGYGDGVIRNETVETVQTYFGKIAGVRLSGSVFLQGAGVTLKTYKTMWVDTDQLENGVRVRRSYKMQEFNGTTDNRGFNTLGNITVAPFNGNDTCGDPPAGYPRNQIPENRITNNVTINNTLNAPITVPVTLIPTLIAPVGIVVRPTLNVDVGGVNVEFGLGGVTFSQPTGLPPGTDIFDDPRLIPPAPITNDNSVEITGGCDLSPVLTRLDDIEDELKKCCDRLAPFPEPSTDEYDVQLLHEGTGGVFNLPSRTFTVTVEIITNPGKLKTIEPTSGERVLFCGWAWFHSQGGLCERMPLDADKKAFKPPERAENKITVSCYAGYTCRVRAWYAKANA